ncbi:carbohydrate kinase [Kitasatospora sp. NPDC093558]|uniref:carbohydrate kinase family protein n=1 Tax=Kitasatospora sp. NPDC093558 TaxID=3155201 RepID=UPI003430A772
MTSTSPKFLVIGECVADVVRADGEPDRVHPGGSPANVAFGLARLGRAASLLTELADDAHGRLIRAHLEGAGVTVHAEEVARTPSAVVELDGDGRAQYAFDIGWTLRPVALQDAPGYVHVGSIAAVALPGADAVLGIVERLRGRASVSYDPNVRPALMGDRAAAVRRVERCVALSHVVKASDEDLAWLYPGEDAESVALRWLGLGPAVVAVTLGAAGAVALTADGAREEAAARRVQVADTVGAGDSFMAAFLHARAAGTPLAGCLAQAVTAAAVTVSRPGANPPSSAELAEALAR